MADIKIEYQDERLTTVMAEKVLIDADVSRKKRKQVTLCICDSFYICLSKMKILPCFHKCIIEHLNNKAIN